jgi:hypothetical protein
MIVGETGKGKDLIAKALHNHRMLEGEAIGIPTTRHSYINFLLASAKLIRECGYFDQADIVGAKNIRSSALVIAREVSAAAAGRVS